MYNVSSDYLQAIKQLSRQFESTIEIGSHTITDTNIVKYEIEESVNPGESFVLGSTVSNKLVLSLRNMSELFIYDGAVIKPKIGLLVGSTYEQVPLGVYNVYKVEKNKTSATITCFDNMIKTEVLYVSSLTYPAPLNSVVSEICTKIGVDCNTVIPSTLVNEFEGYTIREVLNQIGTFLGGFVKFNKDGNLEIKSYTSTDIVVDGSMHRPPLKVAEKPFTIGRLTCQAGENILTAGTVGNELKFSCDIMTQSQLNTIYNTLKTISYLPYEMTWNGNPALEVGDKIAIDDDKGNIYNTLVMHQKLTYSGGFKAVTSAFGKTAQAQEFSSTGSLTKKVERTLIEQAAIKKLFTEDLAATNAKIDNLKVGTAQILDGSITNAKIGDAEIEGAKIANATIDTANIKQGAITTALIETGAIGTAQIADGSITDAKIVSLTANKITAGKIDAAEIEVVNLKAANITVGTINGEQISNNAIGSGHIEEGAITNEKIAHGISGDKIESGSIKEAAMNWSLHLLF